MPTHSSIWRTLIAFLLCGIILAVPATGLPVVEAAGSDTPRLEQPQLQPVAPDEITSLPTISRPDLVEHQIKGESEPAIYIIQLEDAPLATYQGGVAKLAATAPSITGEPQLDVHSQASLAYRDYLAMRQDAVLDKIAQQAGRSVEPIHTYGVAYNGMAVTLTPEEAAVVAAMPDVARVIRSYDLHIQTDTTPQFLNAVGIWDGTNTASLGATKGEGMLIGIIDTGINMAHPSFAAQAGDGYTHTNPLGDGVYTGWCDPSHSSYDSGLACNAKLVGVYSYPSSGDDPIDDHGHGSHTASTAAGNVLDDVPYGGAVLDQIAGMAPRANLISYDVCEGSGGCPMEAILAGIDDAVADGVDVINYSIGGGPQSAWDSDPDSEAFLNARHAGIFVATSAGNDGPEAGTVGSPGNAPWVTTVANTTTARVIAHSLDVTGPGTVPGDLQGMAAMPGSGPALAATTEAPIVYAGDVDASNVQGCSPFATDAFSGSIALIQRGVCTFETKVTNAANAGATAVLIFNNVPGGPLAMAGLESTTIFAASLSQSDGEAVRDWIQSETDATARIDAGLSRIVNDDWADITSQTSSRGPNVDAGFLKPDIAAPGSNIFAASAGAADAFQMMSGTSMASPHVAGAAALLAALHPDWTPAEIQSALMMTSQADGLLKEDAATAADPFDIGAGRLDLTRAATAGLVLRETYDNYLAADPFTGGDPTTLNMASLSNDVCLGQCSWTRTFRNPTDQTTEWAVTSTGAVTVTASPQTFTIAPGATQQVAFTATATGLTADMWHFGQVHLAVDGEPDSDLHLPVAIQPSTGALPSVLEINTRRDAGSQSFGGLETIEVSDLTIGVHGLVSPTYVQDTLSQDPTDDDPFDNLNDTFYQTVDVPAGSPRLLAEILASEAPDLDLFVGQGNVPSEATLVCESTTVSWNEMCDIANPEAGPWWILVQSWTGSAEQPDAFTLATTVVPGDDLGNLTVDGPASVSANVPFTLTLFWDDPDLAAGEQWYGAVTLGSSPANPRDVGTIPVELIRHGDDVIKTVSQAMASSGDVVTYTITVQPNVAPEDLAYAITDTIPVGLSYVPGSATASYGSVSVNGNTLTWTGLMEKPLATYEMSTSLEDPACAMPLANEGAYLNLSAYGIHANPSIDGDTQLYSAFGTGSPFEFWGQSYTGMSFTDDGMAFFDSTPGSTPWQNEDIPSASDPNNLLAMLWDDWEIVYDEATNRGISLANLGATDSTGVAILSYTGIQAYQDPSQTIDFQLAMRRTPSDAAGDYEVIFAYNSISTTLGTGTIGIEDAAGTTGVKYAYDDAALDTLQDGMGICFDWLSGGHDAVVITYQVEVTAGSGRLRNAVVHNTDNPGSQPETAYVDLTVGDLLWLPTIARCN